jgi:hypothetical protein
MVQYTLNKTIIQFLNVAVSTTECEVLEENLSLLYRRDLDWEKGQDLIKTVSFLKNWAPGTETELYLKYYFYGFKWPQGMFSSDLNSYTPNVLFT